MKSITWSPQEGNDAGKVFIITRMPAFTADRWARNVVRALARSGARTPREALESGIAGLSGQSMALFGHLTDDECDAAFQGLMNCVKIQRDPKTEPAPLIEADIQDANTLSELRTEAFKLNMDFFKAAIYQIYPLIAALRIPTMGENPPAA
ncbi:MULTISPECIES: phage tail assembly chaperone [unclassified Saccharibacter]|uniref:phage tail assembly chaperone n=1 Tax=unclassified Saccharibacter TaxID=2648722 RepID=UPI0013220A28|nr:MULTISPECIES: hypothetical protein [unclassified Saccharibacter]MXV35734.1 hypothetical protein [Saccharibacter sp. EH611]MXV58347.1 hypothetical protein [Saccharibacter sp. EH70]MXV65818.1 hypothetical protein [Saccharibacter sp. EH60]